MEDAINKIDAYASNYVVNKINEVKAYSQIDYKAGFKDGVELEKSIIKKEIIDILIKHDGADTHTLINIIKRRI